MSKPDKIFASELLEREVLDLKAGETVGKVVDFAVSRDGAVAQLGILPRSWFAGGQGVTPAQIAWVNAERVCIEESASLAAFVAGQGESAAFLLRDLHGKGVMQQDGQLLGTLADFAFNLTDGRISDLVVIGDGGKRVRVPVETIRAVGRDYIVIERGMLEVDAPVPAASAETAPPAARAPQAAASPAPAAPAASLPAEAPKEAEEQPPFKLAQQAPAEASAAEVEATLEAGQPGVSTKFDEKRRGFLLGKVARRDVNAPDGTLILAKGKTFDDAALKQIIEHGLLGDVFIEMTLNR